MATPSEPPPPYSASSAPQTQATSSSHLRVPNPRNGIPPLSRRSMEDEARELPHGWTRQYDQSSHHQFFVDTLAHPPRSIWHHPYDDDVYLSSLTPEERARVQGLHRVPSEADIRAESSAEEEDGDDHHPTVPPRGAGTGAAEDNPTGVHKLGRKMKDKLTSSTHTEREAARRQRAQDEAAAYERHQHIRRQMSRALETGEPQLLGKDRDGKDVYIEPPQMPRGYGGYGAGGYGYNPYMQGPFGMGGGVGMGGMRYARPVGPYARPYGGGYGGGLGAPLLGGLAGGALLGGLLF
ncbi:hypothetical protein BUE80_DR009215 [Diplocarpon rosae]|nr:hypothetical protein BUE80_DR009215 [Diplocarpon rosae]